MEVQKVNIRSEDQALRTLATIRSLKRQLNAINALTFFRDEREKMYYRITKEAIEADIELYRRRLLDWYGKHGFLQGAKPTRAAQARLSQKSTSEVCS